MPYVEGVPDEPLLPEPEPEVPLPLPLVEPLPLPEEPEPDDPLPLVPDDPLPEPLSLPDPEPEPEEPEPSATWSAIETADVPLDVVTATSTVPVTLDGTFAMIEVLDSTMKPTL